MTFQPIVPLGGYAGWQFLNRTLAAQENAFEQSASISRQTSFFEENIASINTAADLVGDRRLLVVALGAFGLGEDINNKYFIQKVLEDGTLDPDALGNRLADKRYLELSKAFGFGDFDTPRTVLSDFPAEITNAFKRAEFERAVGNQNGDMRLALGLDKALASINETDTSGDGRWFMVMGQPPVREVFERALGLPASFGALDLERQLATFRDLATARFGDGEVSQFDNPGKLDELRRLFFLRSEVAALSAVDGRSNALTLLQSATGAGIL